MKAIHQLPEVDAARIDVVFCDIDDTLTSSGRLPAEAFAALWRLSGAGCRVVPVTGRPAGWCDLIARQWPVAGVVGENGAFYFRYDPEARRLIRRFLLDEDARSALQQRLRDIGDEILAAIPGAALASDQAYRIHDLAIDFCEDVPRLADADIERIVSIFRRAGATAKVSSIHVNGWFGTYDKLGMIHRFAEEVLGFAPDTAEGQARSCYVGDSPNDEPAFRFFDNAVGVANVNDLIELIRHPPTYVTAARGGKGFAEFADRVLQAKAVIRPKST